MKQAILLILFAFVSAKVQAQGTLDKLKFEEAEQKYLNSNYRGAITLLEELEQKGLKNPRIKYLKIMAGKHLAAGVRYDRIQGGFATINNLRKDCDYYLNNYDIEGLEEKYKEVNEVSNSIRLSPKTQQDWDIAIKGISDREKKHKEKIIRDFCNNTIKIEQGYLSRGGWLNRKVGYRVYTDDELIKTFKSNGWTQRKIEFDYDFYVTAGIFPDDEIVKAVLNESDYSSFNNFSRLHFTYAAAQMFINALNEKTGKKFRLIREAELQYIQMGTNKFVEEIVEKKIIGGNKRKGYEYEYKYYYVYPNRVMKLNDDFKNYSESMEKNRFSFWGGSLVESALDKKEYNTFSGKASAIPNKKVASVHYSNIPSDDIGDMSNAYNNSEIRNIIFLVLEE